MNRDVDFREVLNISLRIGRTIGDERPKGAVLDFGRRLRPEMPARTDAIARPDEGERRRRGRMRAHEQVILSGLVEGLILPFVLGQARPQLGGISSPVESPGGSEIPAPVFC